MVVGLPGISHLVGCYVNIRMNRVVVGVALRTLKRLTGPSEPMEKPPTFGDGILPKEVISSVTHVIRQFSGGKKIRSSRGRKDQIRPLKTNYEQCEANPWLTFHEILFGS